MRILLVGADGMLGQAVRVLLQERGHEVVPASRANPQNPVDVRDPESIQKLYEKLGQLDAVACAAGSVPWKPLTELSYQDVLDGVVGKVASQFELVRQGRDHVVDGGSFTLITGVLARDAVPTGAIASLANGAVESFVRAAAIEMPRHQRINVVSPTVFLEALDDYDAIFAGFEAIPVAAAARAYVRSIEGKQTGQIYAIG